MQRKGLVMQVVLASAVLIGSACSRSMATSSTSTGAPGSATTSASGSMVGASTSRGAVEGFMAAVQKQDLQAMSAIWGTTRGAARDQMQREELEKRLIVIQCMLTHDKWSFVEDRARLSTGGRQEFIVSLSQREITAKTSFTTVAGPGGRWFVEIVDVAPLKEFCR